MIINSSPETLERVKSMIHDVDEMKYCLNTFSNDKSFEKENIVKFLEIIKIKLLSTLAELNMYNHVNQYNLPEAIIEISKIIDEVIKFPDINNEKLTSYETLLTAVSSTLKNYGNKIIQEKTNDRNI